MGLDGGSTVSRAAGLSTSRPTGQHWAARRDVGGEPEAMTVVARSAPETTFVAVAVAVAVAGKGVGKGVGRSQDGGKTFELRYRE
jgi:hypothetical protein